MGTLSPKEEARLSAFLEPPRIAVVATIGRTGMPQLTPNWYRYSAGKLTVSTTKERFKYINLVRDNRMAVCIYSDTAAHEYVTLRGTVEIRDGDDIWPDTLAIVERYVPPGGSRSAWRPFAGRTASSSASRRTASTTGGCRYREIVDVPHRPEGQDRRRLRSRQPPEHSLGHSEHPPRGRARSSPSRTRTSACEAPSPSWSSPGGTRCSWSATSAGDENVAAAYDRIGGWSLGGWTWSRTA